MQLGYYRRFFWISDDSYCYLLCIHTSASRPKHSPKSSLTTVLMENSSPAKRMLSTRTLTIPVLHSTPSWTSLRTSDSRMEDSISSFATQTWHGELMERSAMSGIKHPTLQQRLPSLGLRLLILPSPLTVWEIPRMELGEISDADWRCSIKRELVDCYWSHAVIQISNNFPGAATRIQFLVSRWDRE